jgi:hypothetical protein
VAEMPRRIFPRKFLEYRKDVGFVEGSQQSNIVCCASRNDYCKEHALRNRLFVTVNKSAYSGRLYSM